MNNLQLKLFHWVKVPGPRTQGLPDTLVIVTFVVLPVLSASPLEFYLLWDKEILVL